MHRRRRRVLTAGVGVLGAVQVETSSACVESAKFQLFELKVTLPLIRDFDPNKSRTKIQLTILELNR